MTLFTNKSFEDFWNLYDKKVGKMNALKEWKKLKPLEIERIFEHVPFYLRTREKQYRKDPERYLKHKIFVDEIETNTLKIHEGVKREEKTEPVWNPSEDLEWQRSIKKLQHKWEMK